MLWDMNRGFLPPGSLRSQVRDSDTRRVEVRLDWAQMLVMGRRDFVREVEDADAPGLELQGDAVAKSRFSRR